jgi:mannose-6-phosphate isomerase-like protein (cupin superfamily)
VAPRVIGPRDGKAVDFNGFGVRFMAWAEETGGGFSLVEHPIAARTLCAPLHRHSREDEYSFVVEGRMGAQLGDDVLVAESGDLVFKPRGQWHTFWNPDDTPARVLEIISPGGFERYFAEMEEALASVDLSDLEAVGATIGRLGARYGLEADPESVPRLCAEHGLRFRD